MSWRRVSPSDRRGAVLGELRTSRPQWRRGVCPRDFEIIYARYVSHMPRRATFVARLICAPCCPGGVAYSPAHRGSGQSTMGSAPIEGAAAMNLRLLAAITVLLVITVSCGQRHRSLQAGRRWKSPWSGTNCTWSRRWCRPGMSTPSSTNRSPHQFPLPHYRRRPRGSAAACHGRRYSLDRRARLVHGRDVGWTERWRVRKRLQTWRLSRGQIRHDGGAELNRDLGGRSAHRTVNAK